MKKLSSILLLLILALVPLGQAPAPSDQQPVRVVDTTTQPIEKQRKGTFPFAADGVYFSNEFDGARLNKVEKDGEGRYVVTILPENAPINMSPWYAFQVRAEKKRDILVRLVYPEFARHRYDPQISRDGEEWKVLDHEKITEEEKGPGTSGPSSRPKSITMRLSVGKKPLWVSAQELHSSRRVFAWIDRIARKRKLQTEVIGTSKEGRPLRMLKIGNLASPRMMIVISRQHPPEVTGYFAMQAFVEKIADRSGLAKRFRRDWGIYVVPLMNPDGVDAGHWRHNAGGIDLNRDWTTFNQPEGFAVSRFMKSREAETRGKFYFGIDFHSTWDDIYYPMTRRHEGNMPGLVQDWLVKIQSEIRGYTPNIQPNDRPTPAIVSRNYFYNSHGTEAIVFEIGDNTKRDFIRKKGRVGAEELMRLMIERSASAAETRK